MICSSTKKKKSSFHMEDRVLIGSKEPIGDLNYVQFIYRTLESKPHQVIMINLETMQITEYKQMLENSVKCAVWLRENISKGDVITVLPSKSNKFYVPVLAGMFVGAVVNIWDANCRLDLEVLWRGLRPRVIFVDVKHLLEMYGLIGLFARHNIETTVVSFQVHREFMSVEKIISNTSVKCTNDFTCSPLRKDDTAIILYTSNMMTVKKNIMIPYSAFLNSTYLDMPFMWTHTGLFHANLGTYHNLFLFLNAIISSTLLLVWWKNNWYDLCGFIRHFKVQWTYLDHMQVMDFYNNINDHLKFIYEMPYHETADKLDESTWNLHCLQYIVHDFDLKTPWLHNALSSLLRSTKVIQLYSYPEVGIITCTYGIGGYMNVGYASKNIELMIVDHRTGKRLKMEKYGEIYCKSSCSMMNGYHGQNMLTRLAINKKEWLCTGDIGYYTKNNSICVIGNAPLPIMYEGMKMYASDIERYLISDGIALSATVMPVLDATNYNGLIAFIVKTSRYLGGYMTQCSQGTLYILMMKKFERKYKLRNSIFLKEMPYYSSQNKNIKRLYRIIDECLQKRSLCYMF